jgi:trk system potassium uptake protein TrkA
MKIVILGAGVHGSYLASTLADEQHDVIIIDQDPKALAKVSRSADVATRLGSGTDWRVLEELADLSPDLFIAMSSNDETNLVACTMAKNLGYPKTVARIRQNAFLDHSRLEFSRLFFVDHLLGTELAVAHELFKHIVTPHNLAIENFALGSVQMRTVVIPENFKHAGIPLSTIGISDHLLIGLIRRNNKLIFPKGHDHLLPGDEATLIGETHVMHTLPEFFGAAKTSVASVVIVGGSGITIHLCRLLEEQKIHVKIIEQDEAKCEKLAKLFPKATVMNHDGCDFAFLQEEGVESADLFVACTQSHETNILSAALAKQAGCKQVIALVSDESSLPLLKQLGISHALSEKASLARQIHAIIDNDAIVSVASLYDNQAKIMELKISSGSNLVGSPLSDLRASFPNNFIIAMIENRSGVLVPKGNTILTPGDTAIVICSPDSISEMQKIL